MDPSGQVVTFHLGRVVQVPAGAVVQLSLSEIFTGGGDGPVRGPRVVWLSGREAAVFLGGSCKILIYRPLAIGIQTPDPIYIYI